MLAKEDLTSTTTQIERDSHKNGQLEKEREEGPRPKKSSRTYHSARIGLLFAGERKSGNALGRAVARIREPEGKEGNLSGPKPTEKENGQFTSSRALKGSVTLESARGSSGKQALLGGTKSLKIEISVQK